MWHLVGEEIISSLHASTTIFVEMHHRIQTGTADAWAPQWVGGTPLSDLVHRRMRQKHPLFVYASQGEKKPVTVEDVIDLRTWRRSDPFQEAYEIYGTTRQMTIPLFTSPETIRGFILGRAGKNFDQKELEFAQQIQRLLVGVDRHLLHLRRLQSSRTDCGAKSLHGRAEEFGITLRELSILNLLAEGQTAAGIARRLAISPHTVNRHLEKIYRKLDTNDRLTTVLVAQQLGLVSSRNTYPSHLRRAACIGKYGDM